jgi:VCBS repeat-containing protein
VGFSAGNGTDYYELPQSGNEAGMLSLEDTVGNTGKEGVWLFQVRSGVVLPPENVAPVANGDTTEVIAGEQLTIAVADLLANDTDQDGNALSVTGVSDAVHGTVSLDEVNHQVTFIPDEGYVGQASFGYQISDGHGGVSQATVAVQVDPPQNHAPVGAADAYVTDEDTQLVVAVGGGVLANDTDTDSNPLTAVLETGPAHGTLSLNEDGSFVYTPEANYSGEDGFSYRASDGTDSTSPIEVKLTANAVNDAPVAFDGTASGTTNMTITGTLPAASDVDSNGLTYSLVEGSSQHGSATVNANGSFTFTPDAGYSGPADFRYLVTDDQAAASEAATLSILIAPAALHIEESDLKPKLGACDTGAVLGPDDLKTVGAASQAIVYKISALASGVILVDGVIAALGDTFTQADVDSGRVAILAGPVTPSDAVSTPRGAIPGAAASHQDGFAFEVTDGSGQSLHGEFTIAYEQFDTVQTSPWKGAYSGGAGDDYQLGTARGDVMEGKGGCDTIIGGGGDDVMSGGNGNDRIFGGDGRDCITAGSGNNLLDGGKGGDWIAAGNGHNWIFGGDGNDQILAGSGNNHIFGGTGSDCIVVGNGINRIDGGSGNDTITSGKGADTVVGGLGNDLIFDLGGSNKFQLGGVAGAASDGDDVYSTGRGADKFALFTADKDGGTAGSGRDTIKHFNLAEGDRLVAFNAVAGFWDDPNALKGLIHSGAVSGSRSAHGGDLTLVFSDGHDRSSVTLESFFQDNRSCGRNTHDGRVIGESDLLDILKDVVQDGGDFGISGDDFVAKAHDWFDRDFMLS